MIKINSTQMDWEKLIQFIDDRDSGFGKRVQGASPSAIEELQSIASIKLPENYVTYLTFMGKEDGGFKIFSGCMTDVDALVKNLQKAHNVYPKERYLKIGIGRDEGAISIYDYFLDMRGSCSVDARLVCFELFEEDFDDGENPETFLEDSVVDLFYNFADHSILCAVHNYEVNLFEGHRMTIRFEKRLQQKYWDSVCKILSHLKPAPPLFRSENIWM